MNNHKLLILGPSLGDQRFRTLLMFTFSWSLCIILLQTGGRKNFSFSSSQKLVLLCWTPTAAISKPLLPALSLIQLFCLDSVLTLDERVGAKLLLPELRVDRIHSWVLQQLPDEIFQFLHLRHWRVAHLLLKQTTCHLTQELLLFVVLWFWFDTCLIWRHLDNHRHYQFNYVRQQGGSDK